jgi:hypothetical protein
MVSNSARSSNLHNLTIQKSKISTGTHGIVEEQVDPFPRLRNHNAELPLPLLLSPPRLPLQITTVPPTARLVTHLSPHRSLPSMGTCMAEQTERIILQWKVRTAFRLWHGMKTWIARKICFLMRINVSCDLAYSVSIDF